MTEKQAEAVRSRMAAVLEDVEAIEVTTALAPDSQEHEVTIATPGFRITINAYRSYRTNIWLVARRIIEGL